MFPRHTVQLELEALLGHSIGGPIEFAPAMDLTTDHGTTWMAALRLVEGHTHARHGVLEHPHASANLEKLLIHEPRPNLTPTPTP